MRTTFRATSGVLAVLICVLLMLSFSSTSAMAASSNYEYEYEYSNGNGFGNGDNISYNTAVSYYDTWVSESESLQIIFKQNHLNRIIKLYSDKNDKYDYIETLTDWTNAQINIQIAIAQATPENDVELLITQADFLIDNVMYWSAITGYEVECVYEAYTVDGQIVMIDPLRVVNTRR